MRFMLVEQFPGGDPWPVYRRLSDDGRQLVSRVRESAVVAAALRDQI